MPPFGHYKPVTQDGFIVSKEGFKILFLETVQIAGTSNVNDSDLKVL